MKKIVNPLPLWKLNLLWRIPKLRLPFLVSGLCPWRQFLFQIIVDCHLLDCQLERGCCGGHSQDTSCKSCPSPLNPNIQSNALSKLLLKHSYCRAAGWFFYLPLRRGTNVAHWGNLFFANYNLLLIAYDLCTSFFFLTLFCPLSLWAGVGYEMTFRLDFFRCLGMIRGSGLN